MKKFLLFLLLPLFAFAQQTKLDADSLSEGTVANERLPAIIKAASFSSLSGDGMIAATGTLYLKDVDQRKTLYEIYNGYLEYATGGLTQRTGAGSLVYGSTPICELSLTNLPSDDYVVNFWTKLSSNAAAGHDLYIAFVINSATVDESYIRHTKSNVNFNLGHLWIGNLSGNVTFKLFYRGGDLIGGNTYDSDKSRITVRR